VINEGLKADDWVVVGALQQVRPRMTVRTDQIPMPSIVTQEPGAKNQESGGSRQKK
jgi:multidrug efflux system membrane fusion protein